MFNFFLLWITGTIISNNYEITQYVLESYNPTNCTVINYDFTFLHDQQTNSFKVHGLWPEVCAECVECGYPMCCNIDEINYVYPYDPTNFIVNNWFNTTCTEECTSIPNVILFEHEYYKHISCTELKTTDEFLKLVITLYNAYYDKYVVNNCLSHQQLWLNLDKDFNYNSTKCV
jgi:ribonuclease I